MSEDWSKVKEKQLQQIKNMKPKDRLDMVQSIAEINHYISSSCQGWTQWLYNPMIVSQFNQEKLEDTVQRKQYPNDYFPSLIACTRQSCPDHGHRDPEDSPEGVRAWP